MNITESRRSLYMVISSVHYVTRSRTRLESYLAIAIFQALRKARITPDRLIAIILPYFPAQLSRNKTTFCWEHWKCLGHWGHHYHKMSTSPVKPATYCWLSYPWIQIHCWNLRRFPYHNISNIKYTENADKNRHIYAKLVFCRIRDYATQTTAIFIIPCFAKDKSSIRNFLENFRLAAAP
jgi:hypothetical protein